MALTKLVLIYLLYLEDSTTLNTLNSLVILLKKRKSWFLYDIYTNSILFILSNYSRPKVKDMGLSFCDWL